MADSKYIVEVDDRNFDQEVLARSAQAPVLVDFWAEWCAPCKSLMPVLAKLAEEYAGGFVLAKVNSDNNQNLAAQCGVRSLPTVLLFHNGQIVDGFVGAQPESAVRELLQRHGVATATAAAPEPGIQIDAADRRQAIGKLRDLLAGDPDNHRLHPELATLLIAEGEYGQAEEVLNALPAEKQQDQKVAPLRVHIRFAHATAGAPDNAALEQRLAQRLEDSEARYLLGVRHALAGRHEEALEALLAVVRSDRKFGDDAARKAMVDVFTLLGGSGPLVRQYRSRLYSALN